LCIDVQQGLFLQLQHCLASKQTSTCPGTPSIAAVLQPHGRNVEAAVKLHCNCMHRLYASSTGEEDCTGSTRPKSLMVTVIAGPAGELCYVIAASSSTTVSPHVQLSRGPSAAAQKDQAHCLQHVVAAWIDTMGSCSLHLGLHSCHVCDKVHHAVAVAPLIVVP
jgi:hypothetical protein